MCRAYRGSRPGARPDSEPNSAKMLEESWYVELLLVRAVLTAVIVALTSTVQVRCGPRATGWLLGLPLTSLPFLLLVGLQQGPWIARSTAAGIIVGQTTVVACCAAYAYVARKRGWPAATTVAAGVAVAASGTMVALHAPLWVVVPLLALILAGALALWPRAPRQASAADPSRGWVRDVLVRTGAATGCVVVATAVSGSFGPHVAGALVTFPTVNLVLAAFTQRSMGSVASVQLIENMLAGMWCGGTFVFVVAATAGPLGILPACGVALAAAAIARALSRPLTRALPRIAPAAWLRGRIRERVNA